MAQLKNAAGDSFRRKSGVTEMDAECGSIAYCTGSGRCTRVNHGRVGIEPARDAAHNRHKRIAYLQPGLHQLLPRLNYKHHKTGLSQKTPIGPKKPS